MRQWLIGRAVIVGLGKCGVEIIGEARRRVVERWGEYERIAWIEVEDSDKAETQLADALVAVSRLGPEALEEAGRWSVGLGTRVRVCVVADLVDAGAAALTEVAGAARRAVGRRVAGGLVSGLVLLPDWMDAGGLYDKLTLDHVRAVLDEWTRAGDEMGCPLFDGGCFLVGPSNAFGLGFGTRGERQVLAAEMLVQWLAGPLGRDGGSPAWGSDYGGMGVAAWVYPARRVVAWVGARVAQAILGGWLTLTPCPPLPEGEGRNLTPIGANLSVPASLCQRAGPPGPPILGGVSGRIEVSPPELGGTGGAPPGDARGSSLKCGVRCHPYRGEGELVVEDREDGAVLGLVARLEVSRRAVGEEVVPTDWLAAIGLNDPIDSSLEFGRWGETRQRIEDTLAGRLEQLIERRPGMEQQGAELAARLAAGVAEAVREWLDEAAPGRLGEAQVRLKAIRGALRQLADEAQQAADAQFNALTRLDQEQERLKQAMDSLAVGLPATWRGWLALAWRPHRLWTAFRAVGTLRQLGAVLAAVGTQWLATMVEVLRDDLAVGVYEQTLEALSGLAKGLENLERVVREALSRLRPIEDGLYGSLGFALECSLLTPELAAELETMAMPDVETALRELAEMGVRLSSWLAGKPEAEAIVTRCVDYGHMRAVLLQTVRADDLLVRRFSKPEDLSDALDSLMAAAAPFLNWDEAQLSSPEEYEGLDEVSWLGLAEGAGSTLARAATGPGRPRELVATHDPTRVVAVRVVRRVPVGAVSLGEPGEQGGRRAGELKELRDTWGNSEDEEV